MVWIIPNLKPLVKDLAQPTKCSAMLSTGYQLDTQLLQGTYFFHSTLTTAQFSQIMVSLFFSLLLTIMHQMKLNLKIFAAER
jgi:hypothetical protein